MIRHALLLTLCLTLALIALTPKARAATSPVRYSDLYGKECHTTDTTERGSTRRCPGVAGYTLNVHDDDDRTSVDIVAPNHTVYPLEYWDVVTLGYASVGQKAEWRMATRKGRSVPTALVVRLTRLDNRNPGELIAVARVDRDGACVIFKGDMQDSGVDEQARKAAAEPNRKCLGAFTPDRM